MRILLLTDRDFLQHERSMLARLEIGLADEGHRVLHGVPDSLSESGTSVDVPAVYSTHVTYADTGLPFTKGLRAQAFVEAVQAAAPMDAGQPMADAVHVFGRGAWDMGARLARRTKATLLIEVYEAAAIAPACELAAENRGAHLVAADGPIGEELIRKTDPKRVHIAPWGVHMADHAHDDELVARGAGTLTFALLSSGDDADGLKAAVQGAAALAGRPEFAQRGVMVFVDAEVARRQPVWKWADDSGLSGRLSVIADMEGRREMVLQADVLLIADAGGKQRSFVLDAMAAGMLIVARPDPMNSALIDGRTCRQVQGEGGAEWASAIASILGADHAQAARALGESARAFVRAERLASRHVAAVLAAYAKIATPAGATP
ncbi:MAG: glycosyltransferase [Phycisphaerales bacterium]